MWKCGVLIAVVLCLVVCAQLRGEWAAGPPAPVAYKVIPDPPDDAERHVVVEPTCVGISGKADESREATGRCTAAATGKGAHAGGERFAERPLDV